MGNRVLVVDDEKLIVKGIRFSLEQDGMEVDCAYDGEEALEYAKNNQYDMILLDVMLPKLSGFEVCQQIREFSSTPIVMLTAKGEDMDKILGLEYGADDYITKPYNPLEVVARIKAQLRRCYDYQEKQEEECEIFRGYGLELNPMEGILKKNGHEITLTKTEFRILELLMKTPGRIYTKQQIFNHSWDEPYMEDDSTVMVHISNLRNNIEDDPKKPVMIRTIKGLGYKFEKEDGMKKKEG